MKTMFWYWLLVISLVVSGCSSGGGGSDPGGGDLPGSDQGCVPSCVGKQCGSDGCGGTCGQCLPGQICNPITAVCIGCSPDCNGKQCGNDGCGGSCGNCPGGQVCTNSVCTVCTPDCAGKQCGDNGCGGSCGGCPAGQDCVDGSCYQGPSCNDFVKNQDESDVDCGGSCPEKCLFGQDCKKPTDCKSNVCDGGKCGTPETCINLQQDPGETDVDCGGNDCPGCANGKYCMEHGDCLSLNCSFGVCEKPDCNDGSLNQDETDVDCGGSCPPCPDGLVCKDGGDCESGRCTSNQCTSCSDGQMNGPESDLDCGGGECPKCQDGQKCKTGSDCIGGGCEGGKCCSVNACGECTSNPDEVCDGKDNDCDGKTDETPDIGTGELCPNQKGVCQGSKEVCNGMTGWACNAGAYEAWSWQYEATESTCDDKDNDCNGQTDEPPQCCEPQCGGKDCGPDGCGGSCGTCGANSNCLGSDCVDDGDEKWHYEVDGYTITSTPCVGSDGTIYLTTDFPFELVAVKPSGSKDWSIISPDDYTFWGVTCGKDDRLLVRTSKGLKGFDTSGNLKWSSTYKLNNVAQAADGTIYGVMVGYYNEATGMSGYYLQALDSTGGYKWQVPLGPETSDWWFDARTAIGADGTVYVGGPDDKFYMLNPQGGEVWTSQAVGNLDESSPAIGSDGTVYVGIGKPFDSGTGKLYAFSPGGGVKWSYPPSGVSFVKYPVVGPDGSIVFITDSELWSVTATGSFKWKHDMTDAVYEAPAVTKHGIAICGAYSTIHAVDPDGTFLWEFKHAVDSPLILTDTGILYFNYNTGSGSDLWALDVDSAAGSPWPTFSHDATLAGHYTDAMGSSPW